MTMPHNKPHLSIAVDGPVGAGKSTLCDALARRLNILHLDTGAMYRAIGLHTLIAGISQDDEAALESMLQRDEARIHVDFQQGAQVTYLNGLDVTGRLREEAVGHAASAVSRFAAVRRYLVRLQQQIARERSLIIDGRDIGTVVLPDAKVKIYLTASAEERAMRRYRQLVAANEEADYEQVLADLKARDYQDQNRAVDPLRPAEDAIILDSTGMSFEENLERMVDIVNNVYDPS